MVRFTKTVASDVSLRELPDPSALYELKMNVIGGEIFWRLASPESSKAWESAYLMGLARILASSSSKACYLLHKLQC